MLSAVQVDIRAARSISPDCAAAILSNIFDRRVVEQFTANNNTYLHFTKDL